MVQVPSAWAAVRDIMDDAEETLDYGEYDANGDDDANAGCGGDEFGYDDTDDLYGEMRQYKVGVELSGWWRRRPANL